MKIFLIVLIFGIFNITKGFTVYPVIEDLNVITTGNSYSFSAYETQSNCLYFKPDGTKFYITGYGGNGEINAFDLSTAWDVSDFTIDTTLDLMAEETWPRGIAFNPDGTKMYYTGWDKTIDEWNLTSAWDISTASYYQQIAIPAYFGAGATPRCLTFNDDGTKVIIGGAKVSVNYDSVAGFDLSSGWDISTLTYDNNLFTLGEELFGIYVSDNGQYLYITVPDTDPNDRTYMYELTTLWNVSTAVYVDEFYPGPADTYYMTMFNPDHTILYLLKDFSIETFITDESAPVTEPPIPHVPYRGGGFEFPITPATVLGILGISLIALILPILVIQALIIKMGFEDSPLFEPLLIFNKKKKKRSD